MTLGTQTHQPHPSGPLFMLMDRFLLFSLLLCDFVSTNLSFLIYPKKSQNAITDAQLKYIYIYIYICWWMNVLRKGQEIKWFFSFNEYFYYYFFYNELNWPRYFLYCRQYYLLLRVSTVTSETGRWDDGTDISKWSHQNLIKL